MRKLRNRRTGLRVRSKDITQGQRLHGINRTHRNAIIYPGTAPKHWGFNRSNFAGGDFGSYLWKTGNRITISVIIAKHRGRGDFSRLVKAIEADGFTVSVPTPSATMRAILTRWGFVSTEEDFDKSMPGEKVEVMVRPALVPA